MGEGGGWWGRIDEELYFCIEKNLSCVSRIPTCHDGKVRDGVVPHT